MVLAVALAGKARDLTICLRAGELDGALFFFLRLARIVRAEDNGLKVQLKSTATVFWLRVNVRGGALLHAVCLLEIGCCADFPERGSRLKSTATNASSKAHQPLFGFVSECSWRRFSLCCLSLAVCWLETGFVYFNIRMPKIHSSWTEPPNTQITQDPAFRPHASKCNVM